MAGVTQGPNYRPERLVLQLLHQNYESLSSSQTTCAARSSGRLRKCLGRCLPTSSSPSERLAAAQLGPGGFKPAVRRARRPTQWLLNSEHRPLRTRASALSKAKPVPCTRVRRLGKGSKMCVFTVNATIDSHRSNRFTPTKKKMEAEASVSENSQRIHSENRLPRNDLFVSLLVNERVGGLK